MRLVLDLETTSTVDLRKTGAHAYAEHPDTRITVLCFAIDDGPVFTVTDFDRTRADLYLAVRAGATIVAHNYLFEFQLYHHKLVPLGWPPIPLSQWSCTMARSLVAGYPASLELAGRALGLSIQKDHSARDLMLRFARPRTLNPVTWWHETDPVRFQALCDYCAQDVLAERELDRRVPELSERERAVFELDHAINQRGLGIDPYLVPLLAGLVHEAQIHLTEGIRRLTNNMVRSLNQVAQLKDWLIGQGLTIPDLRRNTVLALLRDTALVGAPRMVLQARLDASRSSTAKLAAIASARSQDGRVRGTFQYYGASRTGRWAGRRLQPQNLFRGSIKDVGAALRVIQAGASSQDLDMLFEDSCMGVIASCLRSTITAPPGRKLVIADFSQIEARVLAWLAGQHDMLAVFAKGEDVYTATANAIGSSSRQLGKVLVLAAGFGMGHVRFRETALSYNLTLSENEAQAAVTAWRELNHHIVTFWWDSHRALMRVLRAGPGTTERLGQVTFIYRAGLLLIRLPSGRHLVYRHPRVEQNDKGFDEFTYLGSLGGNWMRLRSWPGKVVENITQAVARDVMTEAMLQLTDVPLIATIHDELIAETPEGAADRTLDQMLRVMKQTPVWAKGLPMDAAGFIVQRYQKG
jgi:DNA polymerase bacteriophage-type